MKKLLFVVILMLPAVAFARGEITKRKIAVNADQLVETFFQMQNIAHKAADRAKDKRDWKRFGQLKALESHSRTMSSLVRHGVFYPVVNGVKVKYAKIRFSAIMKHNFPRWQKALAKVRPIPAARGVPRTIKEMNSHLTSLLANAKHPTPQFKKMFLCRAFAKRGEVHVGGHLVLKPNEQVAKKLAMQKCKLSHGQCRSINCRKVFR